MDSSNLFKHVVDLYDTKPVTRKEYLTFLGVFFIYIYLIFDCFIIHT